MKTLETEFREAGFFFEEIFRERDIAVYKKTSTEGSFTYETIRIREQQEAEIKKDGKVSKIEAGEVYPASSKWGSDGFTFPTKSRAMAKAYEMLENSEKEEE